MVDTVTSAAALEFVRLRLDDIPDCIEIARRSFDELDGDAVRNWFDARIRQNPWQSALDGIGVGVRDGRKLIAFRAMFAQPWWIEGRSTAIAFAAHTSIEPAYRGHGLGSKLIATSCDLADLTGSTTAGDITQKVYRKQGFVAIGGEGNDFFRLRASYAGSMQSRLGATLGQAVGRAFDALLARSERGFGSARGFRLEPLTRCSGEFDELWAQARSGFASCLERSSRYLNWRLFDFPTHPLSMVALRDSSGGLRGYAVWHQLRYAKHVSCAVLRDLFVPNDDDEALRSLMFLAIRHWRRQGMTWASLEVASDRLTPLFAAQGFERVPSNGNRYHVHSRHPLRQATLDGWFRSGLDGDYFDTRPPRAHAQQGLKNEH